MTQLRERRVPTELAPIVPWVEPTMLRMREPELLALVRRVPRWDAMEVIVRSIGRILALGRKKDVTLDARAHALRNEVRALAPRARRAALRRHIRKTVPNVWRRYGDLLALGRQLDLDALLERLDARRDGLGVAAEVAIHVLTGAILEAGAAPTVLADERLLDEVHSWTSVGGRPATRRAALRCLVAVAALAPSGDYQARRARRRLVEVTRGADDDPWSRRVAAGVLAQLEPDAASLLLMALQKDTSPGAILVRARAVEVLLEHPSPWVLKAAEHWLTDPSELVRCVMVDSLDRHGTTSPQVVRSLILALVEHDPEPRIRARATYAMAVRGGAALDAVIGRLDEGGLVASFLLEGALEAARTGSGLGLISLRAVERSARSGPVPLARIAALVLQHHVGRTTPLVPLADSLAGLADGQARSVVLPAGSSVEDLARALVVHAADGFGFSLRGSGQRVRVTRGDVKGLRTWRLLHEVRSPSPAKRQGISHLIGRLDRGAVRVPPGLLAEHSPTAVPGERRALGSSADWAPSLPMVEDFLDARPGRPVVIVTAEGMTRVFAPKSRAHALSAWARLSVRFRAHDDLRSASVRDDEAPTAYVEGMRALGFGVEHTPFRQEGPSQKHFGITLPFLGFVDLGANSLVQLATVSGALFGWTVMRSAVARTQVRWARKGFGVVIGGWGSRGKSGTERLKAAIFEGMGVPVLTKTTGCEAMVLHAPPGGHALELFLYRPYDKASIWEQVRVVRLARRLGSRAFLWECMALKPAFRDILQHRWMKDDLSTLTNAYPDHEDVMGPSGVDVAGVIGGFAPDVAPVLTTEIAMLPILKREAKRHQGSIHPVSRVDRELMPADLLARIPYRAHPSNIALASAVGHSVGVPWVEAVGWMGDHVNPDLGALLVTPPAHYAGREMVFVNGMSANDQLSFVHNWRSTGFAEHDHRAEPDTWLVTVVNNRRDRVARSEVFARILARDAPAHVHVIIGTNVRGFAGYFERAVRERLAEVRLTGPESVDRLFEHLCVVPAAELGRRLILAGGGSGALARAWAGVARGVQPGAPTLQAGRAAAQVGAHQVAPNIDLAVPGLSAYLVDALARELAVRAVRNARPAQVFALYRAMARASLVLVDDPRASADEVIDTVTQSVPPGASARVIGMQNIKGTGLDFAYQWVRWVELSRVLDRWKARPRQREAVMRFPYTSKLLIDQALEVAREIGPAGKPVKRALQAMRAARSVSRARKVLAWLKWPLSVLESVLDPLHSVWRRWQADRVLDDLCKQRISHARAQHRLAWLTQSQKGGWLVGKSK